MMSKIVTHNRAGNRPSKNQRVQGEILNVQLIQLGFLRSLGSATLNEANKSVMLHAEWTSPNTEWCSVWPK